MDKEFLAGLGIPEDISEVILEKFSEEMGEKEGLIAELKESMKTGESENEKRLGALNEKLNEAKVGYLTDLEILKAGGRNIKAIKALIDMNEAFIDEDGLLGGVDISAVKDAAPYLFNREENVIEGAGAYVSGRKKSKADPKSMDYETYKKWRAMI